MRTDAAASFGAALMRRGEAEVVWQVSTRSFSGTVSTLPVAERSAWYAVTGA